MSETLSDRDTGSAGLGKHSEVAAFDLSHLDRIPKSQLRALHLVHENFVRSLASNLSAYLRSQIALNMVSLEQISYAEFLEGLSFPSCIAYVGLAPHEGTAVLELNMTLMFTFLEILMGSKGRSSMPAQRKITDIEKSIMQTLFRVILHDLQYAWLSLAEVSFAVQSLVSEPQFTQVLAPTEAVIVIAIEVRVGNASGMMNLAIPSSFIKRLRYKFEQAQPVKKAAVNEKDYAYMANRLQDVEVQFEAYIDGGTITTRTLLDLAAGDVLVLDHSTDRPLNSGINGEQKWSGNIVIKGDRLGFEVAPA